jgi:hypothetical protein
MSVFVEYSDTSLLDVYLADLTGLAAIDVLGAKARLWQTFKPLNLQELEQNLNAGGDLFEPTKHLVNLINLENITLSPQVLEAMADILNSNANQSIVHLGPEIALNAELKKVWQKTGAKYETLKKADPKVKLNLFDIYSKQLGLKLAAGQAKQIIDQALTYHEILDSLDFISLSENITEAVNSLKIEEKPLPFMLSFNLNKLGHDVKKWYELIGEEDIQLALSLIYTKLDKQSGPAVDNLKQKLVGTDKRIKTSSKGNPHVWWKYFLWEAARD